MEQNLSERIMERLEAGYNLPALSPVALRLVELAADDTCSARDLAGLIEKDPSLAVRLLKLANSAFFQSARPVSTLEQAVVKVGFHRLRIMGLSLSLRDTFPMGKVGPMDYERFWRESLYRALLAKALAGCLKTCNPEEAFAAGLILEIGFLIFFDLFLRTAEGMMPEEGLPLEQILAWEKGHYGLDHRRVGDAALRFWRFPGPILACQLRYGETALAGDSPPLCRVCEQARALARLLLEQGSDFTALFMEADRSCGLGPDPLNDILLETLGQVQDIADQLQLVLDGERDLLEVMERANRALSRISDRVNASGEGGSAPSLPSFETPPDEEDLDGRTLQAVAHEIRNPLMAVGGFARRLAANLDPSSPGGKYAKV
ncbi:MAG: HDOD domain-containing protein, partial [Deltaproteobacteria bacterium]|nr:HDOD domain-containing protein [Deltaproteobacteria bacterium]